MKNIFIIISLFLGFSISANAQISVFEKIYGDDKDNHPTGVKAFGDGIYVPSVLFLGDEEWGIFSKFDLLTGNLEWQKIFPRPLRINDFEYISEEDAFLLVGHFTPFQDMNGPKDNQSFILKIDDTGDVISSKTYFRNGREGFNRILRHSNPLNPAFPFYVLGNQNPTATVNGDDQITLFNYDANLNYNWGREYKYRVTIDGDDEFHRGLIEIPNGDLAMVGNDIIDNDGISVSVNGADGSVIESTRSNTGKIDYYDGIVFNDIAFLVGEYFETGESFIVNGNGQGMILSEIDRFKDIWTDGNGNLFTVGNNNNPEKGGNFPVVCKFSYNGDELTFENAYFLNDDELEFGEGHISVTPEHDRIFYSDARKTDAFGAENFDILIGSFDFDFSSECKTIYAPLIRPFNFSSENINVSSINIVEPNPLEDILGDIPENYTCIDYCSPICDNEAPEFYKIYGDDNRNSIIKLEYYQGAIYALGVKGSSDLEYQAYLMKLNLAGDIEWNTQLPKTYVMNDFIPTANGFLLAGDTRPIGDLTNSVAAKINLDGTLAWARSYDFAGRERFLRIAPAMDANNPSIASTTEFLILGYVTPSGVSDDQSLIKIDENGTEIWRKELDGGGDDQAHSAFRRLENGSYMLAGRVGSSGQLGVLNADGTSALFSTEGGAGTRQFDIVEANNKVYIVGDRNNAGSILTLENSGTKRVALFTLPQISMVTRVSADAAGNLYLLVKGDIGDGNANRNLVYKLNETSKQKDQSILEIEWVKYIDNGVNNFGGYDISVAENRLILGESILDHPSGFGNFDDAIGIFDLDMSGECITTVDGHTISGVSTNTEITGNFSITDLSFPSSQIIDPDIAFDLSCSDLECGQPCDPPSNGGCDSLSFVTLCGDTSNNLITKVKYIDGYYYALGSNGTTGTDFQSFFMKMDDTGTVVWELQLEKPNRLFDFIESNGGFLLTGADGSFFVGTRYSIICKVNDDGTLAWSKTYQLEEKSTLNRILEAPAEPGGTSSTYYYAYGGIKQSGTFNTDDQLLIKIDENGNEIFRRTLDFSGEDDQLFIDFFKLENGNYVFVGNKSTIGLVGLMTEDGLTAWQSSESATRRLLDVTEANKKVYIAGTTDNIGTILVLDQTGSKKIARYTLPQIIRVNKIDSDNQGNIFITANTDNGDGIASRSVVMKLIEPEKTGTLTNLSVEWTKFMDYGETNYSSPGLCIEDDRLILFDSREGFTGGAGNFDMLISAFDLNMTGDCVIDTLDYSISAPSVIDIEISGAYTITDMPIPATGNLTLALGPDFEKVVIDCPVNCDSCGLEFIVEYDSINCTQYQFTSTISSGIAPFTYEWDFDCDGMIDSNEPNPTHDFQSGGLYTICVKITDAEGCSSDYKGGINVFGDNQPPIITCNPPGQIEVETGTCLANFSPDVFAIDDCGSTTILCSTADGQDCPGSFPKGNTTLTYTATDGSGNTSSCEITIEVIDAELPKITCSPIIFDVGQLCDPPTFRPENFITSMSDNCDIVSTSINQSTFDFNDVCRDIPIVITVEDCGGNVETCNTTLYFQDNFPPTVANCPPNITIPDGADPFDLTLTGQPAGFDNCQLVMQSFNDVTIEECPMENVIQRTWIITDQCGNVNDECVQLIRQECDSVCIDFSSGTVEGWYSNDDGCGGRDGVTITVNNNGPAGPGDNVLYGEDECGSSFLINNTDFSKDWTENEGDCFCWDYKIYQDANSATVIPVYSNLNIWYSTGGDDPRDNNLQRATFITNVATTENSNWVRICAPIETCSSGSTLPSNTFGNWSMASGSTCTDWNDLLANVTHVTLGIDYFNNPAEEMAWDNFCFEPCGQIGEPVNCDSLNLIVNCDETNSNDELCCWNLDIDNSSDLNALERVEFRILTSGNSPQWTFESFSGGTGFQVKNDYRFQNIHKAIESSSGNIPNGLFENAINFCFASSTNDFSVPIPVEIKWVQDLGGNLGLANCLDTIYFDCNKDSCNVSFTWQTDCYNLQTDHSFSGFNGTPMLTWTLDGVQFDPNHTFTTSGIFEVCVTATDGSCSADFCSDVIVDPDDQSPRIIDCPTGQITIPTDPGDCTALISLTVEDNCDNEPDITYNLAGQTTGTLTQQGVLLNLGTTIITASATDNAGNSSSPPCVFSVIVEDREPPQISCPDNFATTIPGCQRGVIVNFDEPNISDNCPNVRFLCSEITGDFFQCGNTRVVCTATDAAGNENTCSFDINIECQCAQIISSSIECGEEPDTYNYTIEVENLTGSSNPCELSVNLPPNQGQVTNSIVTWNSSNTVGTLTGEIIPQLPMSSSFDLVVDALCICPQQDVFECSLPVSLTPICCKEAFLEGKEVCVEVPDFPVILTFGGAVNTVIQVDWYLSYEPCDAPVWQHYATSFDATTDVFPPYLDMPQGDNDFCMYAVATVGDFPCSTITSDTANFKLCQPIGCSISDQEFCYTGTPISPAPLVLSIDNSDCQYEIEWLNPDGSTIAGQTGQTSYQPPSLNWTIGQDDCKQEYQFTAQISSVCGIELCTSTITLHNDDAPVGTIDMDPFENQPFCPGEDATLTFAPDCPVSPPAQWTWFSGTTVGTLSPVSGAGNENPLIHSNRLWEDTWFGVETKNGTCDADMATYFIEVRDELAITDFSLTEKDDCREDGIDLSVEYSPTDCDVQIDWYRDGEIIHTSIESSSPIDWTYSNGATTDFSGNYYAVVSSTCCPEEVQKSQVEEFEPPIELILVGPCYRCNGEEIKLYATVNNVPPTDCSFKWFYNGTVLSETSDILTYAPDPLFDDGIIHNFKVEMDCNGCEKEATFDLLQCGRDTTIPTNELFDPNLLKLYPNPINESVVLSGDEVFKRNTNLKVINLTGQLMKEFDIPFGHNTFNFSIGDLSAGVYFIEVKEAGQIIWTGKAIKQ